MLRDGQYWLNRLATALSKVAQYMALNRYSGVPDLEHRVADAQALVVEGAHRFEPRKGKDSLGYFLNYTLAYAAGEMRKGAAQASRWADESISFTDLARDELDATDPDEWLRNDQPLTVTMLPDNTPDVSPQNLGISHLYERHPEQESLLVLKNGMAVDANEYIELVTQDPERARIACGILDCEPDDLEMTLVGALDNVVADLREGVSRWTVEPETSDLIGHQLKDIAVTRTRNGRQLTDIVPGEEVRQTVEQASQGTVPWMEPDYPDVPRRDDNEVERPVDAMARDRHSWPRQVLDLWSEAILAWSKVRHPFHALMMLNGEALSDGNDHECDAVEATETLLVAAVELSDSEEEEQNILESVSRTLAERVANKTAGNRNFLEASFEEFFGVEYSWEPSLPDINDLRRRAEVWAQAVRDHEDVYPSQADAIEALVLHDASPREARQIKAAWFENNGGHRQGAYA